MKKTILVAFIAMLGAASSANACPLGTHPYGGIGPHHNGGWCGP